MTGYTYKNLAFAALLVIAISPPLSSAKAEEIPLICEITLKDGSRATWDFSIDVKMRKMKGLWVEESDLHVEDKTVFSTVKQPYCVSIDPTQEVAVCMPNQISIDRRTLETHGSLGNRTNDQETQFFQGVCIEGKLIKKF